MPDNLSVAKFARSQLWLKLPYPETKFTGKTIIVTGANSGLGLEAARHFVRLEAEKVILAVRNKAKGEAALQSIEHSTGRTGSIEVWELDLADYSSVKGFAAKVDAELTRVDVVVQNAGVLTFQPFSKVAEDEYHMTINVISTFLLAVLLLPKLRQTAKFTGLATVMTFTSSWMHTLVSDFAEQDAQNILTALSGYKDGQKVAKR
jgi:retinol dehydrogenase 12